MTMLTHTPRPRDPRRLDVAGAPLDITGMNQSVAQIIDWCHQAQPHVAVGINANVCNLASKDPEFRRLLDQAQLAYADGQSVVWAARLFKEQISERVATTDLIDPIAREAEQRNLRLFFFGAAPGVAASAARVLQAKYPRLQIAAHDGYVADAQMSVLIDEMRAFAPHLLFVGLGDPLQQRWVAAHRDELSVPAILTCGGLFDWISGNNKRAPKWMIRLGCEWLWRLILEPRRLGARYLRGNPAFIARLVKQRLLTPVAS